MEGSTYQKSLLFTPEGVRDIYGEDCEKRYKVQNDIHAVTRSSAMTRGRSLNVMFE